jgi:hypothetical protein
MIGHQKVKRNNNFFYPSAGVIYSNISFEGLKSETFKLFKLLATLLRLVTHHLFQPYATSEIGVFPTDSYGQLDQASLIKDLLDKKY